MNDFEKEYWSNFYKTKQLVLKPSAFALFIYDYLQKNVNEQFTILDCGCGNGRDSYFLGKTYNVLGIDISYKPNDTDKCKFILDNFCKYNKNKFNIIYSRFTFHSITNEQQEEFLNSINNNSYLCIETRSDKSYNINKVYGDTHYRNYTNIDYLIKLLNKYSFNIIYIEENNGYAKYKDEDPICIRLISKKIL